MTRIYLYIAILLAIAGGGWKLYDKGVKAGEAACEGRHALAAQAATKEVERRDTASATSTESMLDYLGRSLPPIEAKANDSVARIRTIYRDRPIAGVCTRPDGVQAELDQARERANAAGRQL